MLTASATCEASDASGDVTGVRSIMTAVPISIWVSTGWLAAGAGAGMGSDVDCAIDAVFD